MKTRTIKSMQIENTRELFFGDSKEKYLEFRSAWRDFINSGKAKKILVERSNSWGGNYRYSELQGHHHHLIYILMMGKHSDTGFKSFRRGDVSGDRWDDYDGYSQAIRTILTTNHEDLQLPFGKEVLTSEIIKTLRELIKELS